MTGEGAVGTLAVQQVAVGKPVKVWAVAAAMSSGLGWMAAAGVAAGSGVVVKVKLQSNR